MFQSVLMSTFVKKNNLFDLAYIALNLQAVC